MTDFRPDEHIEQYLAGMLNEECAEQVRAYLESHPARAGLVAGLRASAQGIEHGSKPKADDTLAALRQQLGERLPSDSVVTTAAGPVAMPGQRFATIFSYAVSVVAIVLFAIAAPKVFSNWQTIRFSDGHPVPVLAHEYHTERAEYATVTLPDSSTVKLAPDTRIQYVQLSNGERKIELDGQAYFSVVNAERRAFSVTTGDVITRVLGTRFDVRRYGEDSVTQVVVQSGKVAVQGSGSESNATLSAGQLAEITAETARVSQFADSSVVLGWIDGRLMFTNAPVREMLENLERWYGYRFHLSDTTLAARHVTMGVAINRPAEGLEILKRVLGVSLKIEGTTVVLTPRSTRESSEVPVKRGSPVQNDPLHSLSTEVGR